MKTLLEKAKAVDVTRRTASTVTREEIELAVGWANKEITTAQARKALGKPPAQHTGVVVSMASNLREGIRRGIIKLVVIK